ncbi:MAG: secondary thiamine-phosphate synthase enzyme YjbQ [Candidatus Bathyarchaeia archaeon]
MVTKHEGDIINITDKVQKEVVNAGIKNGIVTAFVPGSTGALTTIEYEPGLVQDFPAMLERVAPRNITYQHEKMGHDGNGHSHVRASLIGPSLTIPIHAGELTLGTWQQIIFIELDNRGRSREIVLQFLGE